MTGKAAGDLGCPFNTHKPPSIYIFAFFHFSFFKAAYLKATFLLRNSKALPLRCKQLNWFCNSSIHIEEIRWIESEFYQRCVLPMQSKVAWTSRIVFSVNSRTKFFDWSF